MYSPTLFTVFGIYLLKRRRGRKMKRRNKRISFGVSFDTRQSTLLVIDIKIRRYLAL
jgi:hypothetical protein